MTTPAESKNAPLQPPAPTKCERGPLPVPRSEGVPTDDPRLSTRLADAIRGHAQSSLVLLDERDEEQRLQVVVYADTEADIDGIVRDLEK